MAPIQFFSFTYKAFFSKWWREQDDKLKDQVKMLVNEGRLEFIGGAWSMNDEATTHYQSIIDQFTWGLRFLNDTFGGRLWKTKSNVSKNKNEFLLFHFFYNRMWAAPSWVIIDRFSFSIE